MIVTDDTNEQEQHKLDDDLTSTLAVALATRYALLLRQRVRVPKRTADCVAEAMEITRLWTRLCPGMGDVANLAKSLGSKERWETKTDG